MPRKPKPRGVGRPSLGDDARNELRTVKFTRSEIAAIEAAAKRDDTSVSAWIRDRAVSAASRATAPRTS